ncbi:MAG: hypothetical protein WBW33_05605 [Bryobacteraceae bacterium]
MRLQRSLLAVLLSMFAAVTGLDVPAFASQDAAGAVAQADHSDLKIIVIEGEDAVNIVKKKTAVQPVVEVRDKNDLPIAGIAVTFSTPSYSPSATFINGGHSFTVVTNSAGRATVTGMKPVGTGSFKISVSAAGAGVAGAAVIAQTNTMTAAGVAAGASTGLIVGIVAGVAAAVGIGLGVGLSQGGKPTGTVGAGTATIGPPH